MDEILRGDSTHPIKLLSSKIACAEIKPKGEDAGAFGNLAYANVKAPLLL